MCDEAHDVRRYQTFQVIHRFSTGLREYKVDIKTGNMMYASTDANVYITIYGEQGKTGKSLYTYTCGEFENRYYESVLSECKL